MNKQELLKHNSFLLTQIELVQKKEITLVYRGDSLSNLCNRLNIPFEGNTTNIIELLKRLFMVGEKASTFLSLDEGFRIDEIDDYVFEKIFNYFQDSLRDKNTNTISFFCRNLKLKNFFSIKTNKRIFVEILNNAIESEKILIRNYYLTLLHQLSAINYKQKSHIISTSKSYETAEHFTYQNRDPNRIILHCWQPIKKEVQVIKKFELPSYSVGPYNHQKEISMIGGILPHYISGIELKLTNKFYPNPYIFKNEISKETFLKGLEIDQTNFDSVLSLTNYKRSMATDGEKIWGRTRR